MTRGKTVEWKVGTLYKCSS